MTRSFLVRVWLVWLALFGLLRLGWVEKHLVAPYTALQAEGARLLFGPPAQPIYVGVACSGTDVIALCVGAILAYPTAWRRRLAGAAGGLALILALNIVRIGTLGMAAGTPRLFDALHVYIWPGVLLLAVAAFVLWWMRSADTDVPSRSSLVDRSGAASVQPKVDTGPPAAPLLTVRFIGWAALCLVVFVAASPFYLESAAVLQAAAFVARAAAWVLRLAGIDATATDSVLVIPQGAYLVTQECVSTPLVPLYVAAVLAYVRGWRRRAIALAATGPLFVALGIARLLVVAIPVTAISSPIIVVHAFFQVVLGAALVSAAAVWRAGMTSRAARAALLGIGGGVACAWGFAKTPVAEWLAAAAPLPDAQGAVAFAPVFQVGLYAGVWIAAGVSAQWPRLAAGGGALLIVQALVAQALHLLADRGFHLGVPEVRGWAVVAPLAILCVVFWRRQGTPPATRVGDAVYQDFWRDVGASFPDLGGAPSTTFYAANERRLLAEHLAPLAGIRLLKTDLWDEARNTRILQWAAGQGAEAFGVDISPPTLRLAREGFSATPLRAAAADVRALPFRTGSIDAVYSMGTVEHFDETAQAVAEIFRVLKPGGRAIVGVPNRYDPFLRAPMVAFMSALGLYAYGYEKSYSRNALRRMLEDAGFRVTAETAILFMPGWLRILDLAAHAWFRPLTVVTGALLWPFAFLDRYVPALRRHGYLLATVVEKPGA